MREGQEVRNSGREWKEVSEGGRERGRKGEMSE